MADFPALPFWTDAYLADTTHLTTEQHGAYCLLLFKMWRMPDCNLPDDPKLLARLAGITPAKWPGVWSVLKDFFLLGDNGRWTQKRLTKERVYVDAATTRAKAAAQKRWSDRGNANAYADALPPHKPNTSNGNAPTPTPTSPSANADGNAPAKGRNPIDDLTASDPEFVGIASQYGLRNWPVGAIGRPTRRSPPNATRRISAPPSATGCATR